MHSAGEGYTWCCVVVENTSSIEGDIIVDPRDDVHDRRPRCSVQCRYSKTSISLFRNRHKYLLMCTVTSIM